MSAIRTGFAQRPASVGSKLVVFKGYAPQDPRFLQTLAPVAAGQNIHSGDLLQQLKNATTGVYEFVLAGTASAVGVPAFALDDCTTDLNGQTNGPSAYDVASSKLSAYPCNGDFELGTSRYTGTGFTVGAYLTRDAATGKIKVGTLGTDDIVGQVSGLTDSPINLSGFTNTAGVYTNVRRDDNTAAGTITVTGSAPNQTATKVTPVVRFKTMWIPAQPGA